MKKGKEMPAVITRTIVSESETVVFNPSARDPELNTGKYNSGWITLNTQIVKVEGESPTYTVPALAGTIVTENKI